MHIFPNLEIEIHDYAPSSHPWTSRKTIAETTGATQILHKLHEHEHRYSRKPIYRFGILPFLIVVASVFLCAEDFITEFEYGQMLYRDPHGASCAACHGETGEGKLISEYTDNQGKYVALSGPDIRNASLAQIKSSIKQSKGIMPRYFLTDKEAQTIYAYLQKVNNNKKTGISKLFAKEKDGSSQ